MVGGTQTIIRFLSHEAGEGRKLARGVVKEALQASVIEVPKLELAQAIEVRLDVLEQEG